MASESLPLTLTIPSSLNFLPVARTFVESACQVSGLDEATTNAVVLATNEATSNVIRHAHHNRLDAFLEIHCNLWPDRIEIHLLDEGQPFDVNAVPELNPGELRIGGRGVFLMRNLMDEISCQPRAQGGNHLKMVKRFAAPATGPKA
jgi:serine/threonine-protein kinase RsbW